MKCVSCGEPTIVIDSRIYERFVRRRRKCTVCEFRFFTQESLEITPPESPIKVKKVEPVVDPVVSNEDNWKPTEYADQLIKRASKPLDLRKIKIPRSIK